MTLHCIKLEYAVTFMKYHVNVVSLIFLVKTLTWNKIMILASNLLNVAELLENKPLKSIFKILTNIPISIRFITT